MRATTEERQALEAKGWEFSEDFDGEDYFDKATISIDLTRSITDGEFGHVYNNDQYPEQFGTHTYVDYTLDFSARTAEWIIYDGAPSGSESPGDDDFEGVMYMEVRDVGPMPLEIAKGGYTDRPYAFYDLMRATADWGCDLFEIEEGEYFVRVRNNMNVEPTDTDEFYRVTDEQAAKVLTLSDEEAYRALGDLTQELEETRRWV